MSWAPTTDKGHMMHALMLARRNLGQVWPNPAVGSVVVSKNQVVGIGWTARGGRPHAEPLALAMSGERARGAVLYVTLEPCAHHGKTPPCAEAIIQAGISRVVVACGDPDPRVNGRGVAMLREAGIEVTEGVCAAEAEALNAGFFSVIRRGLPLVALKLATSANGQMVTPVGESKWITGEQARRFGNYLRGEYDALLTGIGTVLADDPQLTCRLPGMEDLTPVRVVLDRQGRLPEGARLKESGADVWVERGQDGLSGVMQRLAERGITRVLVEAGPVLSKVFLEENLVDEVFWFRSPRMLPEAAGYPALPLQALSGWTCEKRLFFGADVLEMLRKPVV